MKQTQLYCKTTSLCIVFDAAPTKTVCVIILFVFTVKYIPLHVC